MGDTQGDGEERGHTKSGFPCTGPLQDVSPACIQTLVNLCVVTMRLAGTVTTAGSSDP
jgi:hypothetical protein